MKRNLLIIGLLLIATYTLSWMIWGESLLFEHGFRQLVNEVEEYNVEFHEREYFIIIAKRQGEVFPAKFSTKIPGKQIVVASDSLSAANLFWDVPENFSWDNFKLFGLQIDLVSYRFPVGELEFYVFGNDFNSKGFYIWGMWDWIRLPI